MFFAEDRFSLRLAKAICASCPARVECEAEAQAMESVATNRWRFGVRAGQAPDERR